MPEPPPCPDSLDSRFVSGRGSCADGQNRCLTALGADLGDGTSRQCRVWLSQGA
jgi:hypothetical protein